MTRANKAAPLERRDRVTIALGRHCRGVGEPQRSAYQRMLRFVAIVLSTHFLVGCVQKPVGAPVVYVVPANYRGAFTIVHDAASGITVPTSNGQFIVTIPASGVLAVRSFDFIRGSHVISAQYANGEAIAHSHRDENIALRIVGPSEKYQTGMVFLIGTRKEADDAYLKH